MTERRPPGPTGQKAPPRCPICGRPRDPVFRPFCSKRCKQVDLARWMNEVYAVPAVEPGDEPDES
ncbi:MAG: DNA gyrase inhibitor YacG [Geminicoccaceae bacterium]|nr:DNA gyrase inhibitor YacG [Geminicoccaceae bacterium]